MKSNVLRIFLSHLLLAVCWSGLTCLRTYAGPEPSDSTKPLHSISSEISQSSNPPMVPIAPESSPIADHGVANHGYTSPKSTESWFRHRTYAPPNVLDPEGMTAADMTVRPYLYWRAWANQRLPLYRIFFFLLFALNAISLLMPRTVTSAREPYETKWFRCLGLGILFYTIAPAAAGQMARLGLYTPLATLIIALVQLASLVGLTVAGSTIGDSILRLLHLDSIIKNVLLNRIACVCVGASVLSLLSLLPGIGPMPRLGNRMLALVAAAGTGALLILIAKLNRDDNTAS